MHKRQDLDHISIFIFFESPYLHKIESKSQLGKGHIPWPVKGTWGADVLWHVFI